LSIDPAPPFSQKYSFEELMRIYGNTEEKLFDRYRALFSLRDMCTDQSVEGMCVGLSDARFSDLFKHEIAFVCGQMQEKAGKALPFLVEVRKR
jgi:deoxyhypusine monooxygenase